MKKKGLTLFEALVVVIIFTILFGLVFEILATGRRSGDIGTTLQDVQVQAKQGLENMIRELYESSTSHIYPSPLTNSANITFQVPIGFDADGELIWGAEGVQAQGIRYSINDQQQLLREIINPYPTGGAVEGGTKVLANFVQSVLFSLPPSSNTLTISLISTKASLGGPDFSSALTSAVYLRN